MDPNFRNKSFIAFLRNQGFPAGMWIMAFFGFFLISGVVALDLFHKRFPIGGILLTFGFIGIYLYFNSFFFFIYKRGRKIYSHPEFNSSEIIYNVKVYIKGFDHLRIKKFPPKLSSTIYDFDKADILLKDNSLILLGKQDSFMGKSYANPVELVLNVPAIYPNFAKILNAEILQDGRLVLTIKDSNYNDEIKISMEDRKEIKLWITNSKTHQGVI